MNRATCAGATALGMFVSGVPAVAFSIHEHKWAGDRGARAAFQKIESRGDLAALQLPWTAAPDGKKTAERWVTKPGAKELAVTLSGSTSAFQGGDILVWVGDRTGWGPGWATFGDLVAIYGDHKAGVDSMNSIDAAELQHLMYNARKGIDETTVNLLHLASTNADHFSEEAVLKYKERHLLALAEARKAVAESDIKYLWRAIHHEAFAATRSPTCSRQDIS
jgi:succinate dehydrogenase flavin-adding protein (antitoxin of CptAB toxin-antitoxin module)